CRPVILLPERLAAGLAADQLDDVLLHELAHVRRGDLWTGHAQALLQCVWWWHPLVWLAGRRLNRAREEAADEAVLAALDREPPRYAETLVAVARLVAARPGLTVGFLGILEHRSALRRRVERLLDGPAPRCRLGWGAALLLAAFAAAALPMAPGPARPAAEPGSVTTPLWQPWSGEAVQAARAAGRIVLVDFTADWHLASRVNRRVALEATAVRERLAALGVVMLEGDHTRFDPEIAAELEHYDRVGLPLTLVFPPQPVGPAEALPEVLTPELVLAALDRAAGLTGTNTSPAPRLHLGGREVSFEELERLVKDGRPAPAARPVSETEREGIAQELARARADLAALRTRYRDGWPAVIEQQARVVHLERELAMRQPAAPEAVTGGGTDRSAGIQQLERAWREQNAKVTAAAERLAAVQAAGHREDSPAHDHARRELEHERLMATIQQRKLAQERFDAAIPQAEPALHAPAPSPATNALFTRFYRLAAHRLVEAIRRSGVPEAARATNQTEAVRAYFQAAGVEVAPPKALFLNEELGVLMVRLPMDELEIVQMAIETLNSAPPMVQLEMQSVTNVNHAGLDDLLGGRDLVVLSQARAGELTRRLQKTAGVKLMAAPKVTTLSGRQAQVQVAEIKTVFRPEQPQGQREDFGLTVDMMPQVEPDGVTLTLVVSAGFREFLGYEEGEATPRPRIRSLQTGLFTVVLLDGQTLLARLPPQPGGAPDDAGVLILVTPTIIDPAGNPVNHGPR
ncbi:MAG TPA: M56 family metallopeptidase, partial [Verrucomicrobiota bacterium]|nr:M56 family metallopeptidase [Verrucomicrobiota bacterium]